jgi:hypothetical protein
MTKHMCEKIPLKAVLRERRPPILGLGILKGESGLKGRSARRGLFRQQTASLGLTDGDKQSVDTCFGEHGRLFQQEIDLNDRLLLLDCASRSNRLTKSIPYLSLRIPHELLRAGAKRARDRDTAIATSAGDGGREAAHGHVLGARETT